MLIGPFKKKQEKIVALTQFQRWKFSITSIQNYMYTKIFFPLEIIFFLTHVHSTAQWTWLHIPRFLFSTLLLAANALPYKWDESSFDLFFLQWNTSFFLTLLTTYIVQILYIEYKSWDVKL